MVERAAAPKIPRIARRVLDAARSFTTPLLPDDYIALLDPRWSTREATGTIVRLKQETPEATTVVVKPSFPWPGHRPGQYLRIGAEIDGIRHWRAYSLTSDPGHPQGLVSVTIKHVEGGLMSPWFTREAKPGTIVFLGAVEGAFGLDEERVDGIGAGVGADAGSRDGGTDRGSGSDAAAAGRSGVGPPIGAASGKALMLSAGSGVTPIFSLVRELDRRGEMDDVVHVHSTPDAERFILGERLREIAERRDGYTLVERLTQSEGRITPENLEELVPDWRERRTFLSGPREMIDVFQEKWEQDGDPDLLELERFQPVIGRGAGSDLASEEGTGGTVRFLVTDVDATCDVGVSILVGGEEAGGTLPYGCRMGICHTCVGRLREGQVRDLRTGELHGEQGQTIRTCVNAPEGHVEIEL